MIDNEALARSAVACKAWRWMAGMLAITACLDYSDNADPDAIIQARVVAVADGAIACFVPRRAMPLITAHERALPDLADPATLGCMLALVREAWAAPGACVVGCSLDGWRFWLGDGYREHEERYPTEAAALVAAIEVAPAREVKS